MSKELTNTAEKITGVPMIILCNTAKKKFLVNLLVPEPTLDSSSTKCKSKRDLCCAKKSYSTTSKKN